MVVVGGGGGADAPRCVLGVQEFAVAVGGGFLRSLLGRPLF